MIKLTKKHTIYEVFNEWAAESVFCLHKPTQKEVEQIVAKEWGGSNLRNDELTFQEFILCHIIIEKEKHVYE